MDFSLFSIVVLAASVYAAAAACGKTYNPPGSFRVVGGSKAAQGTWPWQISLRFVHEGNQHVCGGTIINERWILTAAHCFLGTRGVPANSEHQYYQVRVGEHRQDRHDGTERDHRVERIIKHYGYRGYKPSDEHDIALIKLSTKITYNTYVQPVCMNEVFGKYDHTEHCWISGWGETRGTEDGDHLQQLQGRVWSSQDCIYGWDRYSGWGSSIKKGMVCFGHGHQGACVGDSGGPLVCKNSQNQYVQIGVTSWGHGDCTVYGKPSVYTRVAVYHSWIQQQIANYRG